MRTVAIGLRDIELEELTKIWNNCWQGYYYDMTFTVEKMRGWLKLAAVELEHSLVLRREDQVIGFAFLAREGEQAWLAGTGIAPEARGEGLFRPLMQAQLDEARKLGIREVFLEVLSQNPARKVYEAVGFTKVRQLNIFRVNREQWLTLNSPSGSALGLGEELQGLEEYGFFRPASLAEYFARRSLSSFKPSWQRREDYLSRYPKLTAMLGRGGMAGFLFTGEENPLLLDAWCSGTKDGWQVLSAIMARTGQIALNNQPEDWLSAILRSHQVKPRDVQIEMRCDLV